MLEDGLSHRASVSQFGEDCGCRLDRHGVRDVYLDGAPCDQIEGAAEVVADDLGLGGRVSAEVEPDDVLSAEPESVATDLLVFCLGGVTHGEQASAQAEQIDAGGACRAADRVCDDVELVARLLSEVIAQPDFVVSEIEGGLPLLLASDDADDSVGA